MAPHKPEILAPAGDKACFLAAAAAGADAVYLGLKHFSARMAAPNFSLSELARLRLLAEEMGVDLYVAMNVMAKPGDLHSAGNLVAKLQQRVKPKALIIQDLGVAAAARQAGFSGEIHLSTLANITHPSALPFVQQKLGVQRVILPRELSIDEIKACDQACPPGLALEVFVHGALCYGVSGRCYWSTHLGGKSSLRGRCVQPCRRLYTQDGRASRLFSCRDLHLDVLVKTLLQAPNVAAWKIEGRKKGPHYVHHVTRAYRLLRDETGPEAKKEALELLERALGRPGTHYRFLPQRPFTPITPDQPTASGLPLGKTRREKSGFSIVCREKLLGGDVLRVGTEDEAGHQTVLVRKSLAQGKPLKCKAPGALPPNGAPVFLIDRREPALTRAIQELSARLEELEAPKAAPAPFTAKLPKPYKGRLKPQTVHVNRRPVQGKASGAQGLWLEPGLLKATHPKAAPNVWWWLPPVIWPDEEEAVTRLIAKARSKGASRFVANAPWQAALFAKSRKPLVLWAGPFVNAANALALASLKKLGFEGAIVSPELSRSDYLALARQSPLPLGAVVEGFWPLCISRTLAEEAKTLHPLTSPKGEVMWVRRHGQNHWVFPGWPLNLSAEKKELARAGYRLFVALHEPVPRGIPQARRTSTMNWGLNLL